MKTHDEMVNEWMRDPAFKKEYHALDSEFALFDELIKARNNAGLTQAEVAKRMRTKTPAIAPKTTNIPILEAGCFLKTLKRSSKPKSKAAILWKNLAIILVIIT